MSNLQNKVCAFNIINSNGIMNSTPILFKVHETTDKNLDNIINDHINGFLKYIYDNTKSIDDLLYVEINGIVYDVTSDNDEFELYEKDITEFIDFNNPKLTRFVTDKINEFAKLVLKKIKADEPCNSFVEAYNIIEKHNEKKINPETFIQYILHCFYSKYDNDALETCAQNILTNAFKTN